VAGEEAPECTDGEAMTLRVEFRLQLDKRDIARAINDPEHEVADASDSLRAAVAALLRWLRRFGLTSARITAQHWLLPSRSASPFGDTTFRLRQRQQHVYAGRAREPSSSRVASFRQPQY
jgi:hypothetical protein